MKTLILLFSLISLNTFVFAQSNEVIRLSEPVQETEEVEVFGSNIDLKALNPVSLTKVIGSNKEANPVTVVTTISEVCSKKGCFFIAQDGDFTARITFKDYGFFIPTDSQGKEVVLVGDFSSIVLSEAQAKHYAEDAGKDAEKVVGQQKEYSIIATSVVVPKSK